MPVKIKVKQTGRIKAPNLSDPQLKLIGTAMVREQKLRWSKGINAEGNQAKKLSVKYAIIKQKTLHKRPIRDMQMTGGVVTNFMLRKASAGTIRAENTTRLERAKAMRAQSYDEMIGFAGSDQIVVFNESLKQYGTWIQKAWVPIIG